MKDTFELATLGVRAGQARTEFNENSEALFLTSSFVSDNARQAAAKFSGSEEGNIYSRFSNPTASMIQGAKIEVRVAKTTAASSPALRMTLAAPKVFAVLARRRLVLAE